jgi:hypothetical protein
MATPIENFNLIEGINLDDSSFSAEEILEAQSLVRQYIGDKYKDLDFSELSSLNDLVIRPTAQMLLIFKRLIVKFAETNTLSKALESGNNSSPAIVDALLSNFSLSRRFGSVASGKIKLVVEGTPTSLTVSDILEFSTIDGLVFNPIQGYVASSSPTSADELKIIHDASQRQSTVIIPAVAKSSGSVYNVEQYTPFTVSSTSAFQLISASAFSNFSGGSNDESNSEIINRLIPALSARNLASPLAIEQTLRERFPAIQQISIHGVNSKNMTRNSHNIFGIKTGCFCDVYVKTSPFFEEIVVEKIAEKIQWADPDLPELSNYIGKYMVKTSRDDAPGYYKVNRVTLNDDNILGSFLILDSIKNINTASLDGTNQNYINNIVEGNYSSFIEEYIIFDPIDDPNPSGTSLTVKIYFEGIPQIKEIQDFVNGNDAQTALVDTLIRACIPCLIQISEIKVKVKAETTSAEQIQSIIVDYINSVDPKSQEIRADGIITALKTDSNIVSVDTPLLITGKIIAPDLDNTVVEVFSESTLVIPERLDLGFTKDNIGFFCRKSDIPVTVIEI